MPQYVEPYEQKVVEKTYSTSTLCKIALACASQRPKHPRDGVSFELNGMNPFPNPNRDRNPINQQNANDLMSISLKLDLWHFLC